ncbi:MAG TPA: hypothetical protein VHS58_01860 [Acetobacteraceae bacterium]|jgi:hypothetical protein|nr:hypothetical protein [Acetobacteraceae bacterium]
MDDEVAARAGGTLLLGRLEGRTDALEMRMNRHEDATAARLTSIEQKLDLLQQTFAQGLGGMRVAHWVGGAIMALGGFAASHFWQRPQ